MALLYDFGGTFQEKDLVCCFTPCVSILHGKRPLLCRSAQVGFYSNQVIPMGLKEMYSKCWGGM